MRAPSRPDDSPQRMRIGDFLFDPASGELRPRPDAAGASGGVRRLAPRPAQLLALLAERPGELVGHEAIRQRLWGAVEVDFEQGLHFQVRQVRAALGDTASQPRYIENLPRRGYRLIQPVTPEEDDRAISEASVVRPAGSPRPHRSRIVALAVALAMVVLVLGVLRLMRAENAGAGGAAHPSLAIMPFAPPEGVSLVPDPRGIAERLLLRLAGPTRSGLAVVGPTTTDAYANDLRSVDRMARELDVDYVLNGRWIEDREPAPTLLVELIRSSDRAHVWVEAFPDLSDLDAVAATIADATIETLGRS